MSLCTSHCVPFVFNKLRDKTYLKFLFDSSSYLDILSGEMLPGDYGIYEGYKPVHRVTELNSVGSCNTIVM